MLATAAKQPPLKADDYAFEIKWDGFRMIGYVDGGVALLSRRNQNYAPLVPGIEELADQLGGRSAIFDGELCAVRADGTTDFQALQNLGRPQHRGDAHIAYLLFDVLELDGKRLISLPYDERRSLLESLELNGPAWHTPPALHGEPQDLLEASRRAGHEGLIAKLRRSHYHPGVRSREWLKLKNQQRQEFVIAGYTPGTGSRGTTLGALILAYYDPAPQTLVYAGKVGTGFSNQTLAQLLRLLKPLRRPTTPLNRGVAPRDTIFVEPHLVCEVLFTEWTRDGELRHPVFKGVRDDKLSTEVTRERVV